ncbi:hypothetical protein SCHPADRAFT_894373 [Schizopora paradoxa]|uniref:Hydrophobin n=1 Tax=Schizopora paradoxa TaxID=27342 RepID=A0A0H2R7F8_9AGAM|nr:hypothetical protein SCHPADRAFT_894373 [Schizopora paradoxa]
MLFRSLVALALTSVAVAVALPQSSICLASIGSVCQIGATSGIECCEPSISRCVFTGGNPLFGVEHLGWRETGQLLWPQLLTFGCIFEIILHCAKISLHQEVEVTTLGMPRRSLLPYYQAKALFLAWPFDPHRAHVRLKSLLQKTPMVRDQDFPNRDHQCQDDIEVVLHD